MRFRLIAAALVAAIATGASAQLPPHKADLKPRPATIPPEKWIGASDINAILDYISDTSLALGKVYPDTTTGLAATTEGSYFSVPSSGLGESLILYRKSSGVAVEVTRYPNASAANKPLWDGRYNGWPDPFFRRFNLTSQTFLGRDRWWWNGVDTQFGGWSLVTNSVFDGNALRRAASYGSTSFSGPTIYLDELGATTGDTVTAYVLVVGTGGTFYSAYRFDSGTDVSNVATGSMLSSTGATSITPSATPQWLRVVATVPATATRLDVYPYFLSGATTADIVAVWAFKGDQTKGPDWPTQGDEAFFRWRDTDHEARIAATEAIAASAITTNASKQIRNGYVPYVTWQSTLGDGEMDGDTDYAGISKVMGFYVQATSDPSAFNTITSRIWATDPTANVEWKVWIRASASAFNMSSTTPDDSGTVLAANFPHANTLYSLQLNKILFAAAGQYVFVMFRPANDTTISARRWLYNAGVSPARHGFPFNTTNGWNQSMAFGDPTVGYGQVAIKLTLESEELRSKGLSGAAAAISYSTATSGLSSTTVQGAVDELAGRTTATLVVPPTVYFEQGREGNIYLDNLIPAAAYTDFAWDLSGPSFGQQQNERFTWVPSGSQASTPLTVALVDRRSGAQLATATVNLQAAASTDKSGTTPKVLIIGDSLTNAGVYTQELVNIAGGDAMSIALYGTRGSGSNKHEGRPGWTIANYTSNFSDGSGANPFWISGAVNFPQYLTNNSIPVPDWVLIELGINDVFGQTTDASAVSTATAAFTNLDTLITSIKAAGGSVKVGLMIPTPPSADQDSFGANYANGQTRARFKRNIVLWAQQLISRYSGQTANRIYLVPSNVNLDTTNNMVRAASAPVNSRSSIQVQRQANGVHPDTPGYNQIADGVWAFLKCN